MTGFNSKRDAAADKLQEHDPCPGCIRGGVCRTPKCGRLALPLDHPFRNLQPAQSEKEKISRQMTAEIAAARALAQPAQEAVTWRNAALRIGEDLSSVGPDGYYNMTAQQWLDWAMEQKPRGNNSLAQPAQEPVGMVKELFTQTAWEKLDLRGNTKVYITPPQREWVGLTNEEIKKLSDDCVGVRDETEFIRAIEQALKEKNT